MDRRIFSAVRQLSLVTTIGLVASAAFAQAPAGYYSSVNSTNSTTLRSTLHQVIDDHQRFPYTSGSTDTWDILNLADEDPNNSGRILDVYKNASYPKMSGGVGPYNREHSWPKSYGFPDDGGSNYPYTDCHQLFLCDASYNSARSNKPFRNCNASCGEEFTEFNDGIGGGTGFYPGNSNWEDGNFTSGTWEVWMDRRGDIARAQFYMDIRYEGGTHNGTGAVEPNLILTNNETLIDNSNTGNNESVAYMGMLSVLLQWHLDDPVDADEMLRNDIVYSFQGNRNPFVDHPEWVDCLFNGVCGPGDVTPPAAPTGLGETTSSGLVALNWNNNSEPDLAGYRVYRSVSNGGPYGLISGGLVGTSSYNDGTVVNGTTYYYVVTAEDITGNESGNSTQVIAMPMGSPGGGGGDGDPWINEIHYDNSGGDVGEFVEVAGPEGLDLDQWKLVGYNGNGGGAYNTVNLSGVIQDQSECVGTLSFTFDGLQNGGPDGIALIDPSGTVIEFLSYEGSFTATNGDANGMMSTNIGVTETSSTSAGHSLQLAGSGAESSEFTWQSPQTDTPGSPNAGQFFVGGCIGLPTPPADPTGLVAFANDGSVDLSWGANTEPDLLGYNIYRSLVSGMGFVQLNGAPFATPSYHDASAINGTTYFYVVTAENTPGLESGFSLEAQATPQDVTPPAVPTGLAAVGSDMLVQLEWDDSGAGDLAGYNIYRSLGAAGPFVQQNGGLIISSAYNDSNVTNGVEYFYRVTAVDQSSNESVASSSVSETPTGVVPITPWINEIHYFNGRLPVPQAIEIAGDAGVDLTGWKVLLYSASGHAIGLVDVPAGPLADLGNGLGVREVPLTMNMRIGGIAIVDNTRALRQFLSYGATVFGKNGPAAGLQSTLIPVHENRKTSSLQSLQLTGTGSSYGDFTWQANQLETFGQSNVGQVLQP